MSEVISPSLLSAAVAPASVYVDPTSIDSGLLPSAVITGTVSSTTVTFLVTSAAALPSESVTL